jgi:glycerol-3-phosphate acyltransferase PlsY
MGGDPDQVPDHLIMTASALLAWLGSYGLGSLPTGYLLVTWFKGVDVRRAGSGNIGATNVTRTAGAALGAAVLLVDLLKGFAAVSWLAPWLLPSVSVTMQLGCGLAAVIGHVFPVWLRFRGGRGVATAIGVLLGSSLPLAGMILGVWLISLALWRHVSLASMASAAALPVAQWVSGSPRSDVLLGVLLGGLIIARHRANIRRLLSGTEPRVFTRSQASGAGHAARQRSARQP